jgi:hypothetical protein
MEKNQSRTSGLISPLPHNGSENVVDGVVVRKLELVRCSGEVIALCG